MTGLANQVRESAADALEGAAESHSRLRAEFVPSELEQRLADELGAALKRKPANEPQLGGAVRSLIAHSAALREAADGALEVLVRRGSFERPLYAALARALAVAPARGSASHLARALEAEGGGGLATLSAASLTLDAALSLPLARAARTQKPHLVLAAEMARLARGESRAEHAVDVAPKVKEEYRIRLCVDVLVPLIWAPSLPAHAAPSLALLRDAERHLGRWLLMAELGQRAGDARVAVEAEHRAQEGPASARQAWSLVHWALAPERAKLVRPTVELVSRLSDRPSADKDTTFLFRLAGSGAASAKPMLESLCKGALASTEVGVRAIGALSVHYGQSERVESLQRIVRDPKKEAVRGVALAALYDAGDFETCRELAETLASSKKLATATWGALVLRALGKGQKTLLEEATYRRVQLGWVE